MEKKAWPYIGSTEKEMGSMAPTGDAVRDIQMDSHPHYDSLTPEKSVIPEQQEPSSIIEEGMTSHMENLSDDSKEECFVAVLSEEDDPIAEFECDVAEDVSSKMAGLQPYKSLPESAGLLFPYKKPTNVMYHMGTVSFPIDIIFVGEKNKVKKIYKNIPPGSLATFGCGMATNVLEIAGGLSDRLGISVGNKIIISKSNKEDAINKFSKMHGGAKNVIIKHSSFVKTSFTNWKGLTILNLNSKGISKNAKLSSSLIKSIKPKKERVIAFFIDGLIKKAGKVTVFKKDSFNENKPCYAELWGTATCIASNRTVEYNKLEIKKGETILAGFKSLGTFINPTIESRHIFHELKKYSEDASYSNKFIIASKLDRNNLLELVSARIRTEFGPHKIKISEVLPLDKNMNIEKISNVIFEKYGPSTIIVGDDSLSVEAGSPIPQDTKEQAKRIYKLLEDAEKFVEESKENILQNKSEYEKISSDFEKVKKTKGQFSQSVKRQTKVVGKYLVKIRDIVRGLNKIKDISTTMEIIDSLANSSKQAADIVEEIFDLVEYTDDTNFIELLNEKSTQYEAACDDLISVVDRTKEYINQHILGLTVLSK